MVQVLGEVAVVPGEYLVWANEQVRMALRPRHLLWARRRIAGGGAVGRVAVVPGNGDLVRGRRRGAEIGGGACLAAGGERSGGKKGRKDRGGLHLGCLQEPSGSTTRRRGSGLKIRDAQRRHLRSGRD